MMHQSRRITQLLELPWEQFPILAIAYLEQSTICRGIIPSSERLRSLRSLRGPPNIIRALLRAIPRISAPRRSSARDLTAQQIAPARFPRSLPPSPASPVPIPCPPPPPPRLSRNRRRRRRRASRRGAETRGGLGCRVISPHGAQREQYKTSFMPFRSCRPPLGRRRYVITSRELA